MEANCVLDSCLVADRLFSFLLTTLSALVTATFVLAVWRRQKEIDIQAQTATDVFEVTQKYLAQLSFALSPLLHKDETENSSLNEGENIKKTYIRRLKKLTPVQNEMYRIFPRAEIHLGEKYPECFRYLQDCCSLIEDVTWHLMEAPFVWSSNDSRQGSNNDSWTSHFKDVLREHGKFPKEIKRLNSEGKKLIPVANYRIKLWH